MSLLNFFKKKNENYYNYIAEIPDDLNEEIKKND